MTSSALARATGMSAASASQHLKRLEAGGLVASAPRGRQRWYRLGSAEVARALEVLAALAPRKPVQSLRQASDAAGFTYARVCYDHLAGRLGVALALELLAAGVLADRDGTWVAGRQAATFLQAGGIDAAELLRGRRPFVRACPDWSEHAPHVAGALGHALLARLLTADWVARLPGQRAVRIRPAAAVPEPWTTLLQHAVSRASGSSASASS